MVPGSRRDLVSRASRAIAFLERRKTHAMTNARPIVSFTFDDIDESAAVAGSAILDSHGVKGTFYVAGGICGTRFATWRFATEAQLRPLVEAGHEIGCHTHSHCDVQTCAPAVIDEEIRANEAFMARLDGRIRLENFAYPYGSVGRPQKLQMQQRYDTCRGVRAGLNVGRADLGQLRAIRLYDATIDPAGLDALIAETCRRNAWLVLYTHEVRDAPSAEGCTPGLLDHAVRAARGAGCGTLSIRDALVEIGYRRRGSEQAAA